MSENTATTKGTENGNGKNGQWKNLQRENSATKIEIVGKKGNTKLLSDITKRVKDHRENGYRKMGNRKLGIRFIIS